MGEMERIIDGMEPKEAVAEMTEALKKLLPLLDEDERIRFFMNLVGESSGDNVSSMVHL
jgi:hypothetical protein